METRLVRTIHSDDGSTINMYMPIEPITKEEMSEFRKFIVDLVYRDMLHSNQEILEADG